MPHVLVALAIDVFAYAIEMTLAPDPPVKPLFGGVEITENNTVGAMEVVYGRIRKGGLNIIPPWTHGTNANSLSQVIALAGHEVAAYNGNFIDADFVPIESVNTISVSSVSGAVNSGAFTGQMRLRDYCGLASNSQFVDYELFTAYPSQCTSWFRGAGIAYMALDYDWNDGKLWGQRGVPQVTAELFGKKCYDPRRDTSPGANPTSATYVTPTSNPALCWADFKVNTTYGRQLPPAEIDWNALVTAANACDTPVATPGLESNASLSNNGTGATHNANADGSIRCQRTSSSGWNASVRGSVGIAGLQGQMGFSPNNQTGDFVTGLSTNPALDDDKTSITYGWHLNANTTLEIMELGVSKLVITANYSADGTKLYDANTVFSIEYEVLGNTGNTVVRYLINDQVVRSVSPATTLVMYFDSSMNNATVDFNLNVQRRYTCNGVLNSGSDPTENEKQLIGAMAGHVVRRAGLWTAYAGAYNAPTFDLQKTDWISIEAIQCTASRDNGRFNGVRGYFIDPLRNWQKVECKPRYNDTYKSQDAGERIWLELQQPLCTHEYEAQRKGEFKLRASRNGITVAGKLPPKFLNIANYDTVTFTFAELGWAAKVFRVTASTINMDGSLSVVLREEQAADWADLLASEYNVRSDIALPTLTATAPTVPVGFGLTAIGNQITFAWSPSSVAPEGVQYQILQYPGSLSDAASKALIWEGAALSKLIAFSASSPYWFQGRARVGSNYSAYTPNTFGVKGSPAYAAPSSSGTWDFSASPSALSVTLYSSAGVSGYASGIVVNTAATPVFSWTNPGSVSVTIAYPGSSSTYFSVLGLALYEDRVGTFYCNVADGAHVSSKGVVVEFYHDKDFPG